MPKFVFTAKDLDSSSTFTETIDAASKEDVERLFIQFMNQNRFKNAEFSAESSWLATKSWVENLPIVP